MKCGKCHGRFLRAGALSREGRGIIVFCIVRTFTSTVQFAQFPLYRTLAVVFHCILRYTNNYHHPYIDRIVSILRTVRADADAHKR